MKTLKEVKEFLEEKTMSTWMEVPNGIVDCAFIPGYKEQVEELVGNICHIILSKTLEGVPMVLVKLKEEVVE